LFTYVFIHLFIIVYLFICPFIYGVLIYYLFIYLFMERDSSVGIATRYGLDVPGIESRWGRDFPQPSRVALGPTQPPVQGVTRLSRG
jgi:hypothetical protein